MLMVLLALVAALVVVLTAVGELALEEVVVIVMLTLCW